jgi:hypothetical protein
MRKSRAKIVDFLHTEPFIEAEVEELITPSVRENNVKYEALVRSTQDLFSEYIEFAPESADELRMQDIQVTFYRW